MLASQESLYRTANGEGKKILPVPHPTTIAALKLAIESGTFSSLDQRTRVVISFYYLQQGFELRDITAVAEVDKPGQVWEIIEKGMGELYDQLPPQAHEELPRSTVIMKKSTFYSTANQEAIRAFPREKGHTLESRRKIGLALVGTRRNPELLAEATSSVWQRPGYRDHISEAMKEAKRDEVKELAEYAISHGLLSARHFSPLEIDLLESYLRAKRNRKKAPLVPSRLSNKLSRVLARAVLKEEI